MIGMSDERMSENDDKTKDDSDRRVIVNDEWWVIEHDDIRYIDTSV